MEANRRSFHADIAHLPEILEWVRSELASSSLPKGASLHVELALEEAIVNVIKHTAAKEAFELSLSCRIEPQRQIEFELSDPGPSYNPLLEMPPNHTNEGRGLILIRKCMDALFYRRENERNILTLIKRF